MTSVLSYLQHTIQQRKTNGYEGIYDETRLILQYIQQTNYLRHAQREAFETYIYLKEIAKNKPLWEVMKEQISEDDILDSLELSSKELREILSNEDNKNTKILSFLKEQYGSSDYSDGVYALTMGTGKTVLMTMFILYDIVLSHYHPDDTKFAKNFLVFAPDTTIIQSLKEIKSFDYSLVIPPEYQAILVHIKYHYLEDTKQKLSIPDGSVYNIVVSNSQKIIIKNRKASIDIKNHLIDPRLMNDHEAENARLVSIKSLSQLAIFVDEAHHSFGTNLEDEIKKSKETINRIHENKALVGCINMTGTPYIDGKMIENTVYYYGLKQGIEQGILKQLEVKEYGDVKSEQFLSIVIHEFFSKYGNIRTEGKLPKLAIYTANIEELQEVRKLLQTTILPKFKLSSSLLIENHTKASNTEQEAFHKLDTTESPYQIILLVNKGTEGWNCKSLFATALFRDVKSTNFTLQASTRCLRAVGDNSKKASIYLSQRNYKMLDIELMKNFGTSINEITGTQKKTQSITCVVEKKETLEVTKTRKRVVASEKNDFGGFIIDPSTYHSKDIYVHGKSVIITPKAQYIDMGGDTVAREIYNEKLNRYEILHTLHSNTHLSYTTLITFLQKSGYNKEKLVMDCSNDNQVVCFLIEQIYEHYYDYKIATQDYKEVIEVIKVKNSFEFEVDAITLEKLVVYKVDDAENNYGFHINPYIFDSGDEKDFYTYIKPLLKANERIKDIYFTGGMSNDFYTDFFFNYEILEENARKIKKYFPDFLIKLENKKGEYSYLVIEIKGANREADYTSAKELMEMKQADITTNDVYAKELGFREFQKQNKQFEYRIVFDCNRQERREKIIEEVKSI